MSLDANNTKVSIFELLHIQLMKLIYLFLQNNKTQEIMYSHKVKRNIWQIGYSTTYTLHSS